MSKYKPKIFTSPDGDITVRSRDFGDLDSNNTITITHDGFGTVDTSLLTSHSGSNLTTNERAISEVNSRKGMIEKHPELAEAWEKYKEIEKHYVAWEELNKE
jgi:hypothetical protein